MNACDYCQKPLRDTDGGLCGSCMWWTLEERRREWDEGVRDECA